MLCPGGLVPTKRKENEKRIELYLFILKIAFYDKVHFLKKDFTYGLSDHSIITRLS